VRMGQHVWLLFATIVTEILVITKWSKGVFSEPLPSKVKWGWIIMAFSLVLYPILRVSTDYIPGNCVNVHFSRDSLVYPALGGIFGSGRLRKWRRSSESHDYRCQRVGSG